MQRNGLLLLVLVGALASGLWIASRNGSSMDSPPGPIGLNLPAQGPGEAVLGTQPVLDEAGVDERLVTDVPDPPPGTSTPKTRRLQMVRADDRTPLAGIRAYKGSELLAGPSGPDGWLEFLPPPGRRTTFWAKGWVPREFRTLGLPTKQVLLDRADASLEVQLDSLSPTEGALRSLLEPLDWTTTAETAWSVSLETLSPSRLLGEGLPPGRYQLYVWIGAFETAGIPLEPVSVVLISGKQEFVRLDASAKPDEEVDS